MNRIRAIAALPLFLSLAGAASAATLDIAGKYGNAAGCRYAKTSEYVGEDLVLLTPEEVMTYVTLCGFIEVIPVGDGTRVVTSICGHEGEATQTIEMFRIVRDATGKDSYEVFQASGDSWGVLQRCRL